jgi:hypothetical protein
MRPMYWLTFESPSSALGGAYSYPETAVLTVATSEI